MLTLSPIYARYVAQAVNRAALSEEALFAGTGITSKSLRECSEIELDAFNRLLENGQALLGTDLGLLIGSQANLMTLGEVGVAVAAAPTLREGLQATATFSRLHAAQIHAVLVSTPQGLSLRMNFVEPMGDVERLHAESGALLLQSYAAMISGQRVTTVEYRFHFSRPDYYWRYATFFDGPVSFDWAQSSVEIPTQALDAPSPYYQPELWRQSQLRLQGALREFSIHSRETYTHHVRAFFRSSALPLPQLTQVAAQLAVSERSLNRHLNHESSSFRELRHGVMKEWAEYYLGETSTSVDAIAATLGYQEPSNFRRAFKRWTGKTPGEFRRLRRKDSDV